ncbi:MAG: hypothetical protein DRP84_09790 [Spirochaetes bacterium]|nr:MAG: hypothetical protein DRP84_09790 [Spirochaetota bacterium]
MTAQKVPYKLIVCCVILIIITTGCAFFPSLFNGFIGLDDNSYIIENNIIKTLSPENIRKMFTRSFVSCYSPLVILSFAAEYHFFGTNPFAYHMTNYILNILITLLVFFLIYLISYNIRVAFITAILFGVHPMHVESVAWISERKDVLYAFFYLLALITYVLYARGKKRKYYILTFLLTIFSLLSKPMAVTLPVVFILFDYFLMRQINKKSLFEKIPFFICALAFGLINMYFQIQGGATNITSHLNTKLYFITKVIPFYLYKFIMPIHLSALYPYHELTKQNIAEIKYYIIILILLSAFVFHSRKYTKKIIFGSTFFIITILPVLQIIPAGSAFAADRYIYIPSIGLFYILAVFFENFFSSNITKNKSIKYTAVLILSVIILMLSFLTWKRCTVWKDSITFCTQTLEYAPNSGKLYNNLGNAFYIQGRYKEAIETYKKALAINPKDEEAYSNLGLAYAAINKNNEAITSYKKAIKINPKWAEAYNNLGIVYKTLGNHEEALKLYEEALKINPEYGDVYNNLGNLYYSINKKEEAIKTYKKALTINPDNTKVYYNLGNLYSSSGENKKALVFYKKGIKINPNQADVYNNLGSTYLALGLREKAMEAFENSIEINPNSAKPYNNLGSVYASCGEYEKAMKLFKQSLKINPDYIKAQNNLKILYNRIKEIKEN